MTERKRAVRATWFVLAEKLLKMGTYLVAGVLIARLAGPDVFGQYSSMLATAVIFTVISAVGLNALLVKEFVQSDDTGKVLTNVLVLRLQAAALAAVGMVVVSTVYLDVPFLTAAIASLLVPIAVFQVADSMFEARLETQRVFAYKSIAYLLGLAVKVSVALLSPHLFSLVLAHVAEMAILLIGALMSVRKVQVKMQFASLERYYRHELLRKSLPLLLSSGAVILYMKVDLPMILAIAGPKAAGTYSAATRLCEALFIISTPIIVATFPKLLELYSSDTIKFERLLRKVFALLAGIGIGTYLIAALLSNFAIELLYGAPYAESAQIIRIYALSIPVIFVGDLFSRWLILTNRLALSLYRHLLGLATNIGLNLVLIPAYGAAGAAYASLAGFTMAALLFPALHRSARPFFYALRPR